MSTRQAIEDRRAYWRAEVSEAAKAVDRWWAENQRWQYEKTADMAVRHAQTFLQRALSILAAGEFGSPQDLDKRISPLVEGAYLQIQGTAPQWSDPVVQSWNDAKDVAKTTVTWGAGGTGLGLVLAGAAWLWWTKGR